jgi:hypothetical protein
MESKTSKTTVKRAQGKASAAAGASKAKKSASSNLQVTKSPKKSGRRQPKKNNDHDEEEQSNSHEESSSESDEDQQDTNPINTSRHDIKTSPSSLRQRTAEMSAAARRAAESTQPPTPVPEQAKPKSKNLVLSIVAVFAVVALTLIFKSSLSQAHSREAVKLSGHCGQFYLSTLIASAGLSMEKNDACGLALQSAIRSHSKTRALNMHLFVPQLIYSKIDRVLENIASQLELPDWALVRLRGDDNSEVARTKLASFSSHLSALRKKNGDYDGGWCYEGIIAIDATKGLSSDVRSLLEQPMDDSASIMRVKREEISSQKFIFLFFQEENNAERLRSLATDEGKHSAKLSVRDSWTHRFYQRISVICSLF